MRIMRRRTWTVMRIIDEDHEERDVEVGGEPLGRAGIGELDSEKQLGRGELGEAAW